MKILNKIWKSNSCTQLATLCTKPLNLLIFTPILLIKLEQWEIAVFYILLSNNFFSDFVTRSVGDVFIRALSILLAGQKDISEAAEINKTKQSNETQDWEAFWTGVYTLKTVQRLVSMITLFLVTTLNYIALSSIIKSNDEISNNSVLLLVIIASLRPFVNAYGFGYVAAQRSSGNVSLNNRLSVLQILLSNLAGIIILFISPSLLGLLTTLLVSDVIFRIVLKKYTDLLKKATWGGKACFSKEILRSLLKPVIKRLIISLSNSGGRIAINFLPLFFSSQLIGSYLLTQHLLNSSTLVGMALWNANHTIRVLNYSEGRLDLVEKSINKTIAWSMILYIIATTSLLYGYKFAEQHSDMSQVILSGVPLFIMLFSSILNYLTRFSNFIGNVFEYNIEFKASIYGGVVSFVMLLLSFKVMSFNLFILSDRTPFNIFNAMRGWRMYRKKLQLDI